MSIIILKGVNGMTKNMRFAVLLLTIAVCFAMLFLAFFIVAEAGHDCTGEHCPICYQISVCINTLKKLSFTVVAVAIAAAVTYTAVLLICHAAGRDDSKTPISLKVKLSI